MNHEEAVIRLLHQTLANQVIVLKSQYSTSGASCIEVSEDLISKTSGLVPADQNRQRTTPPEIKFSARLMGIHSIGIRNGDQLLLMDRKDGNWKVFRSQGSFLTGLPLVALIHPRDLSRGDVIYTSHEQKDDFKTLSSYYLCLGESRFISWSSQGGINIWSSTGTYVWKVGI